MNHRDEVHSQLLEAGGQTSAFLEPTNALLDGAAAPVELPVEDVAPIVRVLIGASRDDHTNRVATQPSANPGVTVPFVPGDGLRTGARRTDGLGDANSIQDLFELRAVVDLARRDMRGEGESVTVSNQVDLAAESAARVTQCVVVGFFGAPFFPAPAAARDARMDVPSTHQRSQSMRPSASSRICRASRIPSKTFVRRQELK